LVLTGLAGGFTSAYYAALYSIFLLSVWLVEILMHRKNLKGYLKEGSVLFIMAITPIVVVKGLVFLTDWANDRPDNPWGFFIFHSNIYSIFFPADSPLKSLLGKIINMNYQWEGRAYVGFPATVYALIILIAVVYFILRWKKIKWNLVLPNKQLNFYLAAAVIILLFSMCMPFKLGFEFLLEIVTPLKQFRALGRFSWIFYYVFTVAAAWFFYFFFRVLRKKGFYSLAIALVLIPLSYWSIDAALNVRRSVGRLFNPNVKLIGSDTIYDQMLSQNNIDPTDYQAIFFLPLTNTSGDKLFFERGMEVYGEAIQCSYRTELPMIESFAPRISMANALSCIQMVADSCIEKLRLEDMNEKPILLLYHKEKLTPPEKWLADQSDLLFTADKLSFASLSTSVYKESYNSWKSLTDSVAPFLTDYGSFYTDSEKETIIYNDFENLSAEISFTGEGALYKKKGEVVVFDQIFQESITNQVLELSFWMFIDHRTDNMPEVILTLWDSGNKQLERTKIENRAIYNVYEKWARISTVLTPQPGIRYQLTLKGKFISADDFLIKPAKSHVLVKKTEGFSLFDNFPLKVK
jgi:hypothetical protein